MNTVLANNQNAVLFQAGAVVYQGRLYKAAMEIRQTLQWIEQVVGLYRDKAQVSISHMPDFQTFCLGIKWTENDHLQHVGMFIPVEDNQTRKQERVWLMVQRLWRRKKYLEQLRAYRLMCFETLALAMHPRLGQDSVLQILPAELLGAICNFLV